MKRSGSILIILLILLDLFTAPNVHAAIEAAPAKTSPPPGVQMARTLSVITGVAISPLLGVSAVGCYQYYKAQTPEERAKLPWFASPLFWVPAFLLVAACFLKDTLGTAAGPALKKPFDIAETIEHKISGLVATGAFVPIMINLIHEANATGGQPDLSFSAVGFAVIQIPHWLYDAMLTPIAMAVFFIVFLASNAVNILILLSPFPLVDTALKCFRTGLLASVVVSSWLNPWIGLLWAVVIILVSWLIAGWSFRLSHFGLVFLWDYFTFRKNRFVPHATENKLFLSRKLNQVPARTYGHLARAENGGHIFRYRPWLIFPARTLTLPAGKYEAGRGIFYSEILRVENDSAKTLILLPPRYLGHEETVVSIYNLHGVRNVGLRAAWAWLKNVFSPTKAGAT
jgi:hypothetical protein